MTLRAAPYFPQVNTGDGVTTDFAINFPFLDPRHLNVFVGGVLKVLNTDYVVLGSSTDRGLYKTWTPGASSTSSIIRFLATKIPAASANNINVFRNTPIARPGPSNTIQMGPDTALYTHFRREEMDDLPVALDFFFSATDLAAHTSQNLVAPCDGYIAGLQSDVTEVVTTGGNIGATIEPAGANQAVTGMVIAVANSAAAGKHQAASPSAAQASYTLVKRGQTVAVTAASFATAGAVRGKVLFQPADLGTQG